MPPTATDRPSSYRELRRRPDDGKLGGVCAGIAEYFDLDPLVVRIGALALLFAGPGFFVYILAWIFIPEAAGPPSQPPRVASRPERNKQVLGIILIVFALSVLWGDWWAPARHWMFPLALIGFGGWLLLRRDDDGDDPLPPIPPAGPWPWSTTPTDATVVVDAPSAPQEPDVTAPTTTADPADTTETTDLLTDPLLDPLSESTEVPTEPVPPSPGFGWPGDPTAPPPWESSGAVPPVPPDPERRARRRRRRMIPGVVMGALLVWAGIAALVGISLQTALAVALCIIGVGFIIGAIFGGSWVLLIPGVIVAGALMVTSVVDVTLEGPIGHHEYLPAQVSDLDDPYQVSIGELDLDLTELTGPDEYEVEAEVGVGHLVVLVPLDATVELTTDVGTGGTTIFGQEDGGLGTSTHHTYPGIGEGGQTITLDLEVGVGQIDVERLGELETVPR